MNRKFPIQPRTLRYLFSILILVGMFAYLVNGLVGLQLKDSEVYAEKAEAGQPAFTTAAMAVTMRIRAEATIQRRGRSLTCWRPYMMPR